MVLIISRTLSWWSPPWLEEQHIRSNHSEQTRRADRFIPSTFIMFLLAWNAGKRSQYLTNLIFPSTSICFELVDSCPVLSARTGPAGHADPDRRRSELQRHFSKKHIHFSTYANALQPAGRASGEEFQIISQSLLQAQLAHVTRLL